MSSGAGGLSLEKNVLTLNSGTYFSSCESKFPLMVKKLGSGCLQKSFEMLNVIFLTPASIKLVHIVIFESVYH